MQMYCANHATIGRPTHILYQEHMRDEGPKERPTTHSSSSTLCWSTKCAKCILTLFIVNVILACHCHSLSNTSLTLYYNVRLEFQF